MTTQLLPASAPPGARLEAIRREIARAEVALRGDLRTLGATLKTRAAGAARAAAYAVAGAVAVAATFALAAAAWIVRRARRAWWW